MEDYWNTNIQAGPLHIIAHHISLRRFEQIKRFLHISDAEEDIRQVEIKDKMMNSGISLSLLYQNCNSHLFNSIVQVLK
jgi:hypothetical protein